MRNFSIDLIWTKIQIAITAIGGWLGYFLGGIDGLMIALMIFMALDYVTGVMCAIIDKKLSSAVGFKVQHKDSLRRVRWMVWLKGLALNGPVPPGHLALQRQIWRKGQPVQNAARHRRRSHSCVCPGNQQADC